MYCSCCCYHKGTYFQANHNGDGKSKTLSKVVVATTKVHIFKQITTRVNPHILGNMLLLLPQRYIFSSKSQRQTIRQKWLICCCCYHKGTYFQANHNWRVNHSVMFLVVVATTKVHIFKQITTTPVFPSIKCKLLLLPQRYIFSSKSQPIHSTERPPMRCCCYHKGTYFQANHNGC